MKKYILLIVLMIVILDLIFIDTEKDEDRGGRLEKRGMFVSYIELSKYIKRNDANTSKINIRNMIKNINRMGFNMIILQVRSMSDAIYKSSIYPCSSYICGSEGEKLDFDILNYFIKEAHKNNMEIHAWINPYRVRTSSNTSSITESSPAFKYIGTDTLYDKDGIYFNPSKDEVIDLIVDGVLEIVDNYNVDGIIFDDYFYPNGEIDIKNYNVYIKTHDYISIDEYRLSNVNRMVEKVHKVCKKHHKLFGISPDGNIENNYNKHYADVKKWASSTKYVDYLMPQIYYGFYNESKDFNYVIHEWDHLITNSRVDLMIALAFYKVGTTDQYAKGGSDEWILNNDIIKREIILSRNLKHYIGFALFRYDYLFDEELKTSTTMKEIENMLEVLN